MSERSTGKDFPRRSPLLIRIGGRRLRYVAPARIASSTGCCCQLTCAVRLLQVHAPPSVPPPVTASEPRRRLLAERVVLGQRRVQRPPRRLLHGPPRRRPPVEHLADPQVQVVASVEEGRSPSVPIV